jgi:putative membrane protein
MTALPRMLTADDAAAIAARVRTCEARTGVQVVVALVDRTDRFHGLRWRAFALGSAAAAVAVVAADMLRPDWVTAHTALLTAAAILGAGLALALAASCWPRFARLFLQHSRAHAAVNQRARVLFLERELFATPRRDAILMLAGRFERVMAVIGDTAYRERIGDDDWRRVVDVTTAGLAAGNARAAFVAGLDALEQLLVARGFVADGTSGNARPDAPLEIDDTP